MVVFCKLSTQLSTSITMVQSLVSLPRMVLLLLLRRRKHQTYSSQPENLESSIKLMSICSVPSQVLLQMQTIWSTMLDFIANKQCTHITRPYTVKNLSNLSVMSAMSTLNSVLVDHSVLDSCMLVGIRLEDSNCTMLIQVATMLHSKLMQPVKDAYKLSVNWKTTTKMTAISSKLSFWPVKFLPNQWIQTNQM